jgi:hypothetical protein
MSLKIIFIGTDNGGTTCKTAAGLESRVKALQNGEREKDGPLNSAA